MGAYAIRPYRVTGKRISFLRYNDLIIWKRITFLGYSFHRWNVCGAYAIRPYRVTGKRIAFLRYNDLIIRKRITFLGYSFHRWNVLGAYAIRPYRVTRKRIAFLRSNVGAYCIRPTGCHPKDGKCAKRDTFSGYKDLIIWKRITFLGYSFHRWNVCGAYAIRPYRVTRKRIAFLRYNNLIIRKRITFWIFIFDE